MQRRLAVAITAVVITIFIASSGCFLSFNKAGKTVNYVMPEKATYFLFGVTPSEYFEYDLPIFEKCNGLQARKCRNC